MWRDHLGADRNGWLAAKNDPGKGYVRVRVRCLEWATRGEWSLAAAYAAFPDPGVELP